MGLTQTKQTIASLDYQREMYVVSCWKLKILIMGIYMIHL